MSQRKELFVMTGHEPSYIYVPYNVGDFRYDYGYIWKRVFLGFYTKLFPVANTQQGVRYTNELAKRAQGAYLEG